MSELQQKGLEFAKKIFDDIRAMSADVQGVTRQAFSAKETEVLDYLTKIGQSLQLEITPDRAGNVWMTLPGKDRSLPAFVAGSHVDSVPQGGHGHHRLCHRAGRHQRRGVHDGGGRRGLLSPLHRPALYL